MKKELAKILLERLNSDGFKFHKRDCEQYAKIGTTEDGHFLPDTYIVEEKWNNEDFINWLLNVDDKEYSEDADKINKILTNTQNV
jgi:cell division protein YceG involved in septum cleavage